MVNPFKPDDKVLILRKGIEIGATVRTIFNHEVQVRTEDGELLWRTMNTIRSVEPPVEEKPEEIPHVPEPVSEITKDDSPEEPTIEEPTIEEPAIEEPAIEEPTSSSVDEEVLNPSSEPQPQKPDKGSRKSKKRGKGFLSKFLADDYDQ